MNATAHSMSHGGNGISGRTAIDVRVDDRLAHIAMAGRFDYHAHRDFRKSYLPLLVNPGVQEIRLEMGKVDYMDIPALAMLILLSERARTANKHFVLLAASGAVSRMLDIANFSRIFDIECARG